MNEQLQTIISVALGAAMLFAVIYCISLAISFYKKWEDECDKDEPVEIKPVTDEVKRVTPVAEKPPMSIVAEASVPTKTESPINDELFTEEMSAPISRSEKDAVAYEAAHRARCAYGAGLFVEAYHYAAIARLCGHPRLASMMSQIRVNWRLAGYPDQKEFVNEHFNSIRSAIGRAMLRIDSKHEAERGYACLTDLAADGNDLARDLLKSLPPWR